MFSYARLRHATTAASVCYAATTDLLPVFVASAAQRRMGYCPATSSARPTNVRSAKQVLQRLQLLSWPEASSQRGASFRTRRRKSPESEHCASGRSVHLQSSALQHLSSVSFLCAEKHCIRIPSIVSLQADSSISAFTLFCLARCCLQTCSREQVRAHPKSATQNHVQRGLEWHDFRHRATALHSSYSRSPFIFLTVIRVYLECTQSFLIIFFAIQN